MADQDKFKCVVCGSSHVVQRCTSKSSWHNNEDFTVYRCKEHSVSEEDAKHPHLVYHTIYNLDDEKYIR